MRKAITFLFLGYLTISYCQDHKECSTLHELNNFSGQNLKIPDFGLIPDLENSYFEWNETSSFTVNQGCKLTTCNESYFLGTCREFDRNIENVKVSLLESIKSINCTCAQNCKCTDLKMRKSECGRAYLGKGCNSCNSVYTDLKKEGKYFPDQFQSKVSQVLINDGCELDVYSEEDFEGDPENFVGLHENWNTPIVSYKCKCNIRKKNAVKEPRPSDYPALIDVPDSLDTIQKMINGEYDRHPGLMASLQSVKNKRSPKNAYIILLGLSGAGKSSAINLLFDNPNVTRVGGEKSTTTDIHEFRIPIPVDKLGIANSELRVIDTPGLCDTRGLEQDAKFLATFDDFLSRHEELSKYIPNVVLIFAKFNDNRILGEGANFVKMLRGIDLFRDKILDKKYSNVIFALSHYMSETKAIVRNPGPRLKSFKSVIENYSLNPKPISVAFAENKAHEEELPMMNGFYKLPNGEFYPRNLFEKIQKATISGGDPVGAAIIREGFKDSDEFNVTSFTFPLVDINNKKFGEYQQALARHLFQTNQTEVSNILAKAYNTMDNDLKRSYPEALPYLQRAFNLRNINARSDIPKTTFEIVKFLRETQLNPANLYLLEKAFNLNVPFLKEDLITGHGYNLFLDTPLPSSPFEMGKLLISEIGYSIPNVMTASLANTISNEFNLHSSREDYMNERLKQLGAENSLPLNKFEGRLRPGFNIYNPGSSELQQISAVREYKTFELVLNDKFVLNQKFINMAKALQNFNKSDADSVNSWTSFFNEYGTHVVKSTYGGGAIEITLKDVKKFTPDVTKKLFNLVRFAEDVNIGKISNEDVLNSTNYETNFRGGERKFHVKSFGHLGISESTNILENWRNSLDYSPVILQSTMKLLPISEVVKKVNTNLAIEVQKAAVALFNASLTYEPPPKIVPRGRIDTEEGNSVGVTATFSDAIIKLMEDQKNTNKHFFELIANQSRESREMQQKWQDDLKEQRELAIAKEEKREKERIKEREDQHARDLKWQQELKTSNEKIAEMQSEHAQSILRISNEHSAKMTQLMNDFNNKMQQQPREREKFCLLPFLCF